MFSLKFERNKLMYFLLLFTGERRLDPSACISAILKENPNAEWMLKSEIVVQ